MWNKLLDFFDWSSQPDNNLYSWWCRCWQSDSSDLFNAQIIQETESHLVCCCASHLLPLCFYGNSWIIPDGTILYVVNLCMNQSDFADRVIALVFVIVPAAQRALLLPHTHRTESGGQTGKHCLAEGLLRSKRNLNRGSKYSKEAPICTPNPISNN